MGKQNASVVMRGSLHEFCLPDVLQCVGVSRQHTLIELRGADGSRRGHISLKAGQVLTAQVGTEHGLGAFFEVFRHSPDAFIVFRVDDQSKYPAPLGPLAKLLFDAIESADAAAAELSLDQVTSESRVPAELALVAELPPPQAAPAPTRASVAPAPEATSPRVPVPEATSLAKAKSAVIAVASPKGGVGKTTITLNLAVSFAARGLRTLVVDADINGDIVSMIDAHDKVEFGVYDILGHADALDDAVRATAVDNLEILPASGRDVPPSVLTSGDHTPMWRSLLAEARARADVVLVDCPAGMFYETQALLQATSHVVGVFQAEMIASRSFSMFLRGLESIPEPARPALAGVVVNMFHGRAVSSLEAFHNICTQGDLHRLFDTTIPRSDAFVRSNLAAAPLRAAGVEGADSIAWLFDSLAAEVCERLALIGAPPRPRPTAFLR